MSYYELLTSGLHLIPDEWRDKFQVIKINNAVSCLQFTRKGYKTINNVQLDIVRFDILNNLLSIYSEHLQNVPHAIRFNMNNYKGIYIYVGCHNPETFLKQNKWKQCTLNFKKEMQRDIEIEVKEFEQEQTSLLTKMQENYQSLNDCPHQAWLGDH